MGLFEYYYYFTLLCSAFITSVDKNCKKKRYEKIACVCVVCVWFKFMYSNFSVEYGEDGEIILVHSTHVFDFLFKM